MAGKKSFFEKIGLVQGEEEESLKDIQIMLKDMSEQKMESLEVPEDMVFDEVLSIDKIYSLFCLNDDSNTIYKIQQFESALPKELSSEAKKASVIGILSASGLNVEDLINDGKARKSALLSTIGDFSYNTQQTIDAKKLEISELEEKIDLLKNEINDRKKAQEQQDTIINTEIENIDKIINFIK